MQTDTYPNRIRKLGDIPSVGYRAILFTKDTVTEETVYNLTKAIFENITKLSKQHESLKTLTSERMIDGLDRFAPIHPGALKYFQEIRLM